MDALQIAPSVPALLLASAFAWRLVFVWNLNHAAFDRVIGGLIEKGELDRARKLCAAAPRSLVVPLVAQLVQTALDEPEELLGSLAAAARRELFDREITLRRWSWLGFVALAACGVSAAIGATAWPTLVEPGWFLTGFAFALTAMGFRTQVSLRRALQEAPVTYIQALLELAGNPVPPADQLVAAIIEAEPGA